MNHSVNSMVIIINNGISAQVVKKKDIKTIIRMYFGARYDKEITEMEKFNNALSMKTFNILMNNVHISWRAYLIKINDQNYDISMTYDLSNHKKVPVKRRNQESTSTIESFRR